MIYTEWDLEGEEEMKNNFESELKINDTSSSSSSKNIKITEGIEMLKVNAIERRLWNGLRVLLYAPPCDLSTLLRHLGCPSHSNTIMLKPNIFKARLLR